MSRPEAIQISQLDKVQLELAVYTKKRNHANRHINYVGQPWQVLPEQHVLEPEEQITDRIWQRIAVGRINFPFGSLVGGMDPARAVRPTVSSQAQPRADFCVIAFAVGWPPSCSTSTKTWALLPQGLARDIHRLDPEGYESQFQSWIGWIRDLPDAVEIICFALFLIFDRDWLSHLNSSIPFGLGVVTGPLSDWTSHRTLSVQICQWIANSGGRKWEVPRFST